MKNAPYPEKGPVKGKLMQWLGLESSNAQYFSLRKPVAATSQPFDLKPAFDKICSGVLHLPCLASSFSAKNIASIACDAKAVRHW